jgi:nucleoside-diphosphate-sugar epimerase
MRILIIGASGFIGRHLVRALLDRGHEVIAWVGPRGSLASEGSQLTVYRIDLGAAAQLPLLPCNTDVVLWLAQSPGYKDFPSQTIPLLSVNVLGLARVLEAARHFGAARFVYASTGNVYKASLGPLREDSQLEACGLYPVSKLAGEQVVRLYRDFMNVSCLRLFGIYGPGQQNGLIPGLIARILGSQPVTIEPAGEQPDDGLVWTPCYIADAVALLTALVEASDSPEVLNLAGPERVSIRQAGRGVAESLGQRVEFQAQANRRVFNLIADCTLLRSLVPHHRYVPFLEGIRATVRFLKAATAA